MAAFEGKKNDLRSFYEHVFSLLHGDDPENLEKLKKLYEKAKTPLTDERSDDNSAEEQTGSRRSSSAENDDRKGPKSKTKESQVLGKRSTSKGPSRLPNPKAKVSKLMKKIQARR